MVSPALRASAPGPRGSPARGPLGRSRKLHTASCVKGTEPAWKVWTDGDRHQWIHSPGKFPSGGFRHDLRTAGAIASGCTDMEEPMSGATRKLSRCLWANYFNIQGARRTRTAVDNGRKLGTEGSSAPNDVHIPLANSPF